MPPATATISATANGTRQCQNKNETLTVFVCCRTKSVIRMSTTAKTLSATQVLLRTERRRGSGLRGSGSGGVGRSPVFPVVGRSLGLPIIFAVLRSAPAFATVTRYEATLATFKKL